MERSLLLLLLVACVVEGLENEESGLTEARGKGKYAVFTNLAIALAAKVGLYKIVLGIAFVIAAVKMMVVMAWALAIAKYVPHARPKHKMHFFYVIATKLFILKVVYGIIFYVMLTKGWHFALWFLHYLKEKKHVEYIEHEEPYHHHHHGHDYHSDSDYSPYSHYESYGDYSPNRKKVYDSDGSYSVKNYQTIGKA